MHCSWYIRPEGPGHRLRKAPRPASWNKAIDPDQIRLREYLDDTEDLLAPSMVSGGPLSLRLNVGVPDGRNLIDVADLDNYAYPLVARMRSEQLVSVWCSKSHAAVSQVIVSPARRTTAPERLFSVRTTASSETTAYKEQVRSAVADAREVPAGGVRLQVSFVVSPRRNWLNLWKPTIDALDPLLGRTDADRDWHPRDGRITDLGLHVATDPALRNEILVCIAAEQAAADRANPT